MNLLVGSSNKGKLIEISEALAGLDLHILQPSAFDINTVPAEHGSTYQENALEKARFYFSHTNVPTLADDSGIVVEALQNELGIHTRRWGAGPDVTDHQWIEFFLDRMASEENRRAKFMCTLAFIDETGKEHFFEGSCDGTITSDLQADFLPGLPISACFLPDGFDRVYSALTVEEKNGISHRGRALQQFRTFLEQR